MKKLVMSVALTTMLASPAFAQADANMFPKDVTASISTHAPRATRPTSAAAQRDSLGAYGRAGGVATFYGDPDPNIQFQLNRESEEGVW